ncbi:MAG TPA: hypothetical protein DEQ09_03775 [Bacteroidales bacterium]|nr:hypothetical protein [Bacteroidales bacterium]
MKRLITFLLLILFASYFLYSQVEGKKEKEVKKSDPVFVVVEEMPTFQGGDANKFKEWVQKRVEYPRELIQERVEGKVFVMFVVEPDGSVTNASIMRGLHPKLDKETLNVVNSSPLWKPGLQRDVPVRVRFSITIEYNLI